MKLSPALAATMSVMESRNPMARRRVVAMPSQRRIGPCKVPMQEDMVCWLSPEDTCRRTLAAPGHRRLDYAKNAGFEAKASEGNRTGGRSCRRVFDAGRRCIRSRNRWPARGYTVSGHRTGSHDHAHRGGNLRRQLGDVLRLRQGSAPEPANKANGMPEVAAAAEVAAARPRLRRRRRRRLPRLRRQRLPRLRRQRLRRLRHRLHRRLRRLQL